MPDRDTVRCWILEKPEFSGQYARAREEQADYFAAEIIQIADDARNDYMDTAEGERRLDSECVQRSKLRVDARKWLASKMAPKKYGERQEIEHSGGLKVEHHLTRDVWKERLSEMGVTAS